ncbi:MAG: type IX secretion system sortase PorU, partial [Cytophagales bacterium]|nr:type IX secretion system sortase PorU [Cytophagales bacterium]
NKRGTFMFNYTGHGNVSQLASENIFNKPMISTFTNMDKLTFGIFATCEFGRFDDPEVFSGGQAFLMSEQGGAIGVFVSARPVYSNTNYQINDAFYRGAFKKTNGIYSRLGDIYKYTKNNSLSGINNRNYALLGDPSMRLEYPEQNIIITRFNDTLLSNNVSDTLRALSKVSFSGEIRDNLNIKNTNFNGQVYFIIYDKENTIYTLGQESDSPSVPFKIRNNVIYNGLATVSSGGFNISMVIPKDIAYNYGIGKISVYAENSSSVLDAGGNDMRFVVGGSNPNAVADNTPPKIQLFMNDESFVFGGFTSANSLFIAKIFDENGINVSRSSVGHEITSVISTNKSNVVIMNDYYNTDLNTYKSGRVQYPYKDLPQGQNSITFKAWDTYNNSSEAYLEFVVANNQEVAIKNLLNYPNPFTTHTTFHFDHNKPGDDLEITVQIFTISGKLVRT